VQWNTPTHPSLAGIVLHSAISCTTRPSPAEPTIFSPSKPWRQCHPVSRCYQVCRPSLPASIQTPLHLRTHQIRVGCCCPIPLLSYLDLALPTVANQTRPSQCPAINPLFDYSFQATAQLLCFTPYFQRPLRHPLPSCALNLFSQHREHRLLMKRSIAAILQSWTKPS
jgi:hypothetical protein